MGDGKGHHRDYLRKTYTAENIASALTSWSWRNGQLTKNPYAHVQSMDALKEVIYSDIISMMFDDADSAWGHSLNFVGYEDNNTTPDTLGFGIDKYGYSHYEFTEATQYNHLGENAYSVPSNDELIAEFNTAKKDQDNKQQAANDAKTANDTAQQALKQAKTNKQSDDQAVAAAQANQAKAASALNDATTALSSTETTLNNAKTVQASAQKAVDDLSADLKTKQAAVNKASQELKTAQSALTDAQNNLKAKQNAVKDAIKSTLNQANQAVASAQKAIDDANAYAQQLKEELAQAKKTTQNAQTALQNANDQLAAAQKAQQTAQQAVDAFNADQAAKRAVANRAQQALDQAKSQLADTQSALQNAKNTVSAVEQTLAQKNNDVKTAQVKLANDQNTLKQLNDNLADLQNAPKALQAAKDQLAKDQKILSDAQAELNHQKDLQAQAVNALADAKAATSRANDALAQATTKLNNANAALKQAQQVWATLHNDAHLYGSTTQVAPVTITVGDALPARIPVQNGFIVNTPSAQILVAMPASTSDSNTGKVPSGTYAVFANLAQAQKDAQTPGTYTEPVTIVFPDGSTYPYEGAAQAQMKLTVLPKPVKQNNNPVVDNNTSATSTGTSQAQQEAQTGHYHIINNTVVNSANQPVSGWTVKNGQMVSPSGEAVSAEVTNATPATAANVQGTVTESTATKPVTVSADKVAVQSANNNLQSNSAEFPQTGNNNNEILAFIVLALASALSFLGIGKRQHN